MSTLLSAIQLQDVALARKLLQRLDSKEINLKDKDGRTALHLACSLEDGKTAALFVNELLAKGADMNEANVHGTTPLQKAVMNSKTEIALALVKSGADVRKTNARGLSALELARTQAFADVLKQAAAAATAARGSASRDVHMPPASAPSTALAPKEGSRPPRQDALRRLWHEQQASRAAGTLGFRSPNTFAAYVMDHTQGVHSSTGTAEESSHDIGSSRVSSLIHEAQEKRRAETSARLAKHPAALGAVAKAAVDGATGGSASRSAPGAAHDPLPSWMRASSQRSSSSATRATSTSDRPGQPAHPPDGVSSLLDSATDAIYKQVTSAVGLVSSLTDRVALAIRPDTSGREDPHARLARQLADAADPVGVHVATFLATFLAECARLEEAVKCQAGPAVHRTSSQAYLSPVGSGASDEAEALGLEVAERIIERAIVLESGMQINPQAEPPARSPNEEHLLRMTASVLMFESELFEALHAAGLAQPVIDQARAKIEGHEADDDAGRGLLELLELIEAAFMPQCLARLRPLHSLICPNASADLKATRQSLRLVHPDVIGLRESLVVCDGVPCSTALEASWIYQGVVDAFSELPQALTIAGKLRKLTNAFEAIVVATHGRCKEGLSADDLVPLLTLAIVTARIEDVAFEGFVLETMISDVLVSGRESYCVCSLQVALGFLKEVKVEG